MFLKSCDLISEINCIYFKGSKIHKSIIGGFLTILAYIIVIFFAFYFSIDAVYKKNPTSYFFQKFIKDAGTLYLNSTMFHFVELLDPDDNVVMDERSWMIFGTETYIDSFLVDFNISKESHWNYGLCNDNDIKEFKDINEDLQFLKAWCVRGYWDAILNKYFTTEDKDYIPPYVAHGTGSKTLKNIGYGLYVAKCQNISFRNNCKTMEEINEEQKKLLRIKVSVVDNNFDVTLYDDPVVPYFLDIKSHLTGETFSHNNMNFNPVAIQTNDGLVFNNNKESSSYVLDFNSKIYYERGNSTLLSGWYFLITNLCQTYSRTYPKLQDALANVGGALKAILFVAEIINYFFNQWIIILDVQYECEKLGLDYSFFNINNMNNKPLELKLKRNNYYSNNDIEKNKSQIPLTSIPTTSLNKNLLENKKMPININNYINVNQDHYSKSNSNNKDFNYLNYSENAKNKYENNDKRFSKIIKIDKKRKKDKKFISFCSFIKSLFSKNVSESNNKSNIRLMHKFWINKISEENIVQMDLKLYKLSNKSFKKADSINIHNLIDDSKENSNNNVQKKIK